ncbi:hypothetical protein CYMTET_34925 [Cymbomonas tetramitiformis]|uniref:Uncharacterized protein n=1 Tax=Cymbomonas tetramitiformis TaxID=36881 RepID=A0AAE0KPG8_9CHLO|nr:hypothetical protein CYMTET_34925 [Cymbomonas tetramitiformis]
MDLLDANANFGMASGQVRLIKQEKVACFTDNAATLATEPGDRFAFMTKPHGHGDVHMVMHTSGTAEDWHAKGVKWVCFFQDTNSLVFRAITAAIGNSATNHYVYNSVSVPRKAKEAIGQ